MLELVRKVEQWAEDRNLIDGSTPEKQLEKAAGELVELTVAVTKDSMAAMYGLGGQNSGALYAGDVASELGDVTVVLIILAKQLGFEFEDCLSIAYDKIKDRRGEMRNGKFVKEEDL